MRPVRFLTSLYARLIRLSRAGGKNAAELSGVMATDYIALRQENVVGYGTRIPMIGGMLLANRYDKRTHFVFELLQNSEDALGRRNAWTGSREVRLTLSEKELRISHYGAPFDTADVRGVCGIDGRPKITPRSDALDGFKSVYAFTDNPKCTRAIKHLQSKVMSGRWLSQSGQEIQKRR